MPRFGGSCGAVEEEDSEWVAMRSRTMAEMQSKCSSDWDVGGAIILTLLPVGLVLEEQCVLEVEQPWTNHVLN